jgi:hypothetical protein
LAHLWLDDVALGTKMNKNFHHHQSLRKPKKKKLLSSSLSHTHRATSILTSSFINNKKVSDVSIKKVAIFMTNNEQKKEHQFFGNPFFLSG